MPQKKQSIERYLPLTLCDLVCVCRYIWEDFVGDFQIYVCSSVGDVSRVYTKKVGILFIPFFSTGCFSMGVFTYLFFLEGTLVEDTVYKQTEGTKYI